ncbi:MAG: hypothetical protein KME20_22265 [Kaiparowitsia implicata GSE-PSE-MK54-09C]|nr:hypothetical protein [Kaiparowitsia implicata GSE-PSE-MK54-09C]
MEDRFYALLKQRLREEIEANPPRFPWESGPMEYELEPTALQVWTRQLRAIALPTPLPDIMMERLFSQCQTLLQSSLRDGAKLVKAVEAIFPQHPDMLNELAGWVMAAPARSPEALLADTDGASFPSQYDAATESQKMALSLMAAHEILETLTCKLTSNQPQAKRDWLTDAGMVRLEVNAKVEQGFVSVRAHLPCAGCLVFRGNAGEEATARRADSGSVAVAQFDLQPEATYLLDIQLELPEHTSLTFAVQLGQDH